MIKKKVKGKSKGNRAERDLARLFSQWWGSSFTRTPQSGGFSTKEFRNDFNAAGDLVTTDDSFPFCVECKWQEDWHMEQLIKSDVCDPWAWWVQTVGETPEARIPLLVFKRNHHPWYYMTLDDLGMYISGRSFIIMEPKGQCRLRVGLLSDFFKVTKSDMIKYTNLIRNSNLN